ncbi:MAG: alginate lyase family protein [Niabella sp.]|nr:alginate lyase family protein [Niabella sp.]
MKTMLLLLLLSALCWPVCSQVLPQPQRAVNYFEQAKQVLATRVLQLADSFLNVEPVTITAWQCARSAGGKHDFYSEADYAWPNPASVDSPYITKDGMTNPDNFTAHRHAMIRLSKIVGTLASAYRITGNEAYVTTALRHCKAWFVDTATLMQPHLLYAQAIKGRFTGWGIGIIDAIHLMEVVQGLRVMQEAQAMDPQTLQQIKQWFAHFLTWLTTHPYGKDEMNTVNNHATCWVMQVACYAKFTGNQKWTDFCINRYKQVLLPNQMNPDGRFPQELRRTKPYGYSLFNLDAMATICQLLSTPNDNLWNYQAANGASIQKGLEFLVPFINHKDQWPYRPDVMYWDNWPVAQPALIFGAAAFHNQQWLDTWIRLDHFPQVPEVIRNLPVRNPLIWMDPKGMKNME